jgi:ubiquinone/menaquinone biosynthesis C-methylase UbiE
MAQSFDADQIAAHEKATWNRCATIYESTLVSFTQLGFELVAGTHLVAPNKRVLDIGCGPGVFTARLAREGAEVVGIDFSDQMIRIAKQQFPAIDFRVADAERLPFEDGAFDLVIGIHVVHHLARPRVVIESVFRVTKPDGHFAFSIPDQLRQASFGSFFSAVSKHHQMEAMPGGPLLMESDPETIRAEFLAGGFRECRVERRRSICHLQSLEPLLEVGWKFANLEQGGADVKDRIRTTTYTNAEPYKWADGSYEFPDEILLGVARK